MKHRAIGNMTINELWKYRLKLWDQKAEIEKKLRQIEKRDRMLRYPDL